ncbi:MAG: hypothetical protein FWH33_09130 [Oscillospiraceae bacterium]|nr:hypothetical protein [Oscillospiraceae bacterium]
MSEVLKICVSARFDNIDAAETFELLGRALSEGNVIAAVARTGSTGYYGFEPLVIIIKHGLPAGCFANVNAERAAMIAEQIVAAEGSFYSALGELPLWNLQRRVATRRCGLTDPHSIDDFIGCFDGYKGLTEAENMPPSAALERLGVLNVTEHGGLGKPIYDAWKAFGEKVDLEKTVICKALDNDIEAHMAVLLLEGDPHGVLEGLLIAAHAVGASRAIIALPKDLGDTFPMLINALAALKDKCLSEDVSDIARKCDIVIREVPRALVASEDSALLRFLDGYEAIPVLPGEADGLLGGSPALVVDIETIAGLGAAFFNDGAASGGAASGGDVPGEAASDGAASESFPKTKILTLNGVMGDVQNHSAAYPSVTIEVPVGTAIQDIFGEIGSLDDIFAFQFGGPTSLLFGSEDASMLITNDTAAAASAAFGTSLLSFITRNSNLSETLETLARFLHSESCGKCVFCREGLLHLSKMIADCNIGRSLPGDDELAERLGRLMRDNCLCNFGATAGDAILSLRRVHRKAD